jgi:hypothetical protein
MCARERAQYRHAYPEELVACAVLTGSRLEESLRVRGCLGIREVPQTRAQTL